MEEETNKNLRLNPSLAKEMIEQEKAIKSRLERPSILSNSISGAAMPDKKMSVPTKMELESFDPEARNEYQSAAVFIRALASNAGQWKQDLPDGYRPAVLAILYGGMQISVTSMAQVSFHGIQIEGTLNGSPCSVLAHQSTVQVLCFGELIEPEIIKRPIGFIWADGETEV